MPKPCVNTGYFSHWRENGMIFASARISPSDAPAKSLKTTGPFKMHRPKRSASRFRAHPAESTKP
jgi:hypothetical protein